MHYSMATAPNNSWLTAYRPALSRIIMEALQDEVTDDELILSFACYLHIGLIRAAMTGQHASLQELYDCIIESDNGRVQGMADILLHPFEPDEEPGWFIQWMQVCEQAMARAVFEQPRPAFSGVYSRMCYQIYKQLDLNEKMSIVLSYYLQQLFREQAPDDQLPD